MKQRKFFLLIIFLLPLFAQAQQASKNQLKVQQVVIDAFNVLSNRDAESLRKLCTTDMMFYEYGEAWSLDTAIDIAITKNTDADFKRTNKLDFLSTNIMRNTAWTTYYLQSDVTRQGKSTTAYFMETVILVREKKDWKIKVLHSTRINKN